MTLTLSDYAWAPHVPDSIDGKPLATSVSDLVWTFPYERLPSNRVVSSLLRPELVVLCIVLYINSKAPLQKLCKKFGITGTSTPFKIFVALHNLNLAIFSGVVTINAWLLTIHHYRTHGFNQSSYCDTEHKLWHSGFGSWATIFYLSKFFEYVDTWILVMKGKNISFLQVFHHTGVALNMWGGVLSQGAWMQAPVLLNSIIHTFMYSYFFIKTLRPTLQIKAAKYLTTAQIAQFFLGIIGILPMAIIGNECDSAAARFSLLSSEVYAVGLILLFTDFASKKYRNKKKKKQLPRKKA